MKENKCFKSFCRKRLVTWSFPLNLKNFLLLRNYFLGLFQMCRQTKSCIIRVWLQQLRPLETLQCRLDQHCCCSAELCSGVADTGSALFLTGLQFCTCLQRIILYSCEAFCIDQKLLCRTFLHCNTAKLLPAEAKLLLCRRRRSLVSRVLRFKTALLQSDNANPAAGRQTVLLNSEEIFEKYLWDRREIFFNTLTNAFDCFQLSSVVLHCHLNGWPQ